MDWCVDTRVGGAARLLESQIAEHLARHAIEPSAAEFALPAVRQALEEAGMGPLWVTLDWSAQRCVLLIRDLAGGDLPGAPIGPGVTLAHEAVRHLARQERDRTRGESSGGTVHQLAVTRTPELDIDLSPAPAGSLPAEDPALLLGVLTGQLGTGGSLEDAAARAGATLADLLTSKGLECGTGTQGAVDLFLEAERRLGADFELVDGGDGRAVVRNRRCPFGPATSPSMCRFTSALAGGLAARDAGRSDVSVLETLAAGDRECRLVIDTQDRLDRSVAHRYTWPPPSPDTAGHGPRRDRGRSFQVTLTLQLPRDRLSVPITRHLIRAAMDEVGVVTDDADAVDLAVTEACANVIDHSGPGDAYDVAVSIGPFACHIRVVDVGRGFDHEALSFSPMAARDAEHGRGVALMHALVDQVRFESEPERGTVVHLVKRLRFEESAAAHKLLGEVAEPAGGPET